ncbi:MAG: HNH endonuclease [Kangiella sp.]|nr:MAG: HNH endonuclease [Kangiella sp.]
MRFNYSNEQLDFLQNGFLSMRVPELTTAFNRRFKLDKKTTAIKSKLTRSGFTCGRKPGLLKGEVKLLTTGQVAFIRSNYTQLTLAELTAALNERFNLCICESQLKSFVKNHKIKSGRTGCFEKGSTSWNTGTKGICKANSGSFQKGDIPSNLKPFGHERKDRGGYILIKVDQVNPHTGHRGWYRHKAIVNWEKQNGLVSEGMNLRFIDGDKLNVDVENLETVSKALNLRLNHNKINVAPNEIKPTIRAISELEVKTFERMKK